MYMVSLQTSLDCVLSTHLFIFFSSQSPADVYACTSGSAEILRSENVSPYDSVARTKPAVRAQVFLLICHTITKTFQIHFYKTQLNFLLRGYLFVY